MTDLIPDPVVEYGQRFTGVSFFGPVVVELKNWDQLHLDPEWITNHLTPRLGPEGSIKFRVKAPVQTKQTVEPAEYIPTTIRPAHRKRA